MNIARTFTIFCFILILMSSIVCLADGTWEYVSLDSIDRFYGFTALAADSAGNVWIGTSYGGLFRYNGITCELAGDVESAQISWIRSIAFAPDGSVWICGYLDIGYEGKPRYIGGISHFGDGSWTHFTEDDGLASNAIKAVAVGNDGTVWAGAEHYAWPNKRYFRGLTRYDGTSWTVYDKSNGLTDNRINDLAISDDGILWTATGDGISIYDGADWTQLTAKNGLPGVHIRRISLEYSGAAWFLSSNGVTRYDGNDFITYTHENVFSEKAIYDLDVDSFNNVWIVTDKGLSFFDSYEWNLAKTLDTSVFESIRYVSCGPNGVTWFLSWQYNTATDESERYLLKFVYDTSAVSDRLPALETVTDISISPNPFNSETTIHFTLPHEDTVQIDIFNCLGQHVASLANTMMPSGSHKIRWDGNDNNGNPVSSGVYIARIGNDISAACRRMTLLR